MKLKSLILLTMTVVPAWAVHAAGADLLSAAAASDGQSGTLLWVGLGLMVVMALRNYR